jgi:hypothetical protein
VQVEREALRATGVDVERQVALGARIDRLAGRADERVDLAAADVRLGRAAGIAAGLVDAAVQYLPLATYLGLLLRPWKWILYVFTGFDRLPSSVPIV